MGRLITGVGLALVLALAAAGPARADGVRERVVLPAKRGLLQAFLEINLSDAAAAKPIAIAPDLWYGATDKLTLGLVHSSRGATGFTGATGDGICVTGPDNGCEATYSTVGVDARYHLKDGPLAAAADVGLHAADLDPTQLAVKVGAIARWHSGKMAVEAAPSLFFGITNRVADGDDGGQQLNEDTLFLPATFLYAVATKVSVAVQAGVVLPFEDTAARWQLPVSLGATLAVSDPLFVDVAFSLPILAGGPVGQGFGTRTLTVGGGYAF